MFVTPGRFLDEVRFPHQPTTADIAQKRLRSERFVIQLIGGQYTVYALNTLRAEPAGWCIGLPKFVTEDYDTAVMWATMQGEKT